MEKFNGIHVMLSLRKRTSEFKLNIINVMI